MLGLRSHIDTREPGRIEDIGVCHFGINHFYTTVKPNDFVGSGFLQDHNYS